MYKTTRQVFSNHPPKLLYDIVNDTNAYKIFVPFCQESEVLESVENRKHWRLVFAKGLISRELITENTLYPNERITINLVKVTFLIFVVNGAFCL